MAFMKRIFFILSALGILAISCNNSSNTQNNTSQTDTTHINGNTLNPPPGNNPFNNPQNTKPTTANTPAAKPTPQSINSALPAGASRWEQTDQLDLRIHKKMYFANITSTYPLHLKSGAINAGLLLKFKDGKNEAVLRMDKGGEFTKNAKNNNIKAIFDSTTTVNLHGEVSEYMPNCITIKDADKLIAKIKTSKRLIFEADVENEAPQKIIFDVEGLKWTH